MTTFDAAEGSAHRRWMALVLVSTSASSFLMEPTFAWTMPSLSTSSVRLASTSLYSSTEEEQAISAKEEWRREDLFGTTLIDQTLTELEVDSEFQETTKRYEKLGKDGVTKEERAQRRRALTSLGVPSFAKYIQEKAPAAADEKKFKLQRKEPTILQLNIGLFCNQACSHCHVESSPLRKEEQMTAETAAQCLKLLASTPSITTLDITGGAPELNPQFRYLVQMARSMRPKTIAEHTEDDDTPPLDIIDRCNLTVLQEPGQEDLVQFLKDNKVHIVASLPCYSESNVDSQRGNGVFERSIAALLALNDSGYGTNSPTSRLDLVYNPGGAFLPPDQTKLEGQYKDQLRDQFGITFDSLFTITNMPIKRFADYLHREGKLQEYMDLLVQNFNFGTVKSLMCLDTVSVDWTGKIYDCDFNQQLGYTIGNKKGGLSVFDVETLGELQSVPIRTDNHCFGCTAGSGSS